MRRAILICSVCLLWLFSFFAWAQPQTILVVESYHKAYQWDASYVRALKDRLGSKYNLVFFEMDTKRLPLKQHAQRADEAWALYQKLNPALVILGDDAAMEYLSPRLAKVETPVVYLGINNNPRVYPSFHSNNFTGVLERPFLKRSVVYLKQLLPDVRKVLVLFDGNVTSDIVWQEVFESKDTQTFYGVTIDFKRVTKLDEWKNAITTARDKGFDAVVIGLYQSVLDKDGKSVDQDSLMEWSSLNSVVPPFAFWDFAVGSRKAIGGFVLRGYEMGLDAADLVASILEKGAQPKSLSPIYNNEGQFVFSRDNLKRWKITLPRAIEAEAVFTEDGAGH